VYKEATQTVMSVRFLLVVEPFVVQQMKGFGLLIHLEPAGRLFACMRMAAQELCQTDIQFVVQYLNSPYLIDTFLN
jgi:hypothetical protein